MRCEVAVRYRGQLHPASVARSGAGGAEIRFDAPAHAVVPGQVAVFYLRDRVLGGGTIEAALPAPAALAPAWEAAP
jgi:tRNA-specific 2-thiouridylase